jgi:hypothetical protein
MERIRISSSASYSCSFVLIRGLSTPSGLALRRFSGIVNWLTVNNDMKTTLIRFQLFLGIMLLMALAHGHALAADQDSGITLTLKNMLTAIQNGSPEDFAKEGNETFKQEATQSLVDQAKERFGTRLKSGYKTFYLAELNQQGHKVHVWKITFTDGGDDLLVRVSFRNGKVAGLFFHY